MRAVAERQPTKTAPKRVVVEVVGLGERRRTAAVIPAPEHAVRDEIRELRLRDGAHRRVQPGRPARPALLRRRARVRDHGVVARRPSDGVPDHDDERRRGAAAEDLRETGDREVRLEEIGRRRVERDQVRMVRVRGRVEERLVPAPRERRRVAFQVGPPAPVEEVRFSTHASFYQRVLRQVLEHGRRARLLRADNQDVRRGRARPALAAQRYGPPRLDELVSDV
mmetsp:Transcript_18927/g.58253  ORF Transcript_18927/g.58253 Transcript_18927/m.58253 type:complete len:224 (+) Transcript_18927:311-982(+)